MSDLQIRIADWHKDNTDLRRIRESVFIQEQGVTPEQEWDSDDATATHFIRLARHAYRRTIANGRSQRSRA